MVFSWNSRLTGTAGILSHVSLHLQLNLLTFHYAIAFPHLNNAETASHPLLPRQSVLPPAPPLSPEPMVLVLQMLLKLLHCFKTLNRESKKSKDFVLTCIWNWRKQYKISPMWDWWSTPLEWLSSTRDLHLGSVHTAYRHASLIELYLHIKFH